LLFDASTPTRNGSAILDCPQSFPSLLARYRPTGKIGKKLPFRLTGCRRTIRAVSLGAWDTEFPCRPIMLLTCSRRLALALVKFLS
jgi:hypothetical protein